MEDEATRIEAEIAASLHAQAELARDMAAVAAEHGRDTLAAQLRATANELDER